MQGRKEIDRKYFRAQGSPSVAGRCSTKGASLQDLRELRKDKVQAIRSHADLMGKADVDERK